MRIHEEALSSNWLISLASHFSPCLSSRFIEDLIILGGNVEISSLPLRTVGCKEFLSRNQLRDYWRKMERRRDHRKGNGGEPDAVETGFLPKQEAREIYLSFHGVAMPQSDAGQGPQEEDCKRLDLDQE